MKVKTKMILYDEIDSFPELVYKYRSWNDSLHKEIITTQIVFMAEPTSFKDSLDCKLQKRYDLLTDSGIYNYYLQDSKKKNPKWTIQQHIKFAREWDKKSPMRDREYIKQQQAEHFKEFDGKCGILSLTANPNNFLMWKEYSNQHEGFCVGFDSKRMFKHLGGGGHVSYYDKLPDILPFDSFDEEHAKQIFSKESKWSFEEEYRTFKYYQEQATVEDRKITLPKDCYKEIIFGAKQSEVHRQEIISICNEQELVVEFYIETIDTSNKVTISKYPIIK